MELTELHANNHKLIDAINDKIKSLLNPVVEQARQELALEIRRVSELIQPLTVSEPETDNTCGLESNPEPVGNPVA